MAANDPQGLLFNPVGSGSGAINEWQLQLDLCLLDDHRIDNLYRTRSLGGVATQVGTHQFDRRDSGAQANALEWLRIAVSQDFKRQRQQSSALR